MIHTLFIGTYTRKEPHVDGRGEGIYIYTFDTETCRFGHVYTQRGIVNPSFLTISRDRRYLFAVSEIDDFEETSSGFGSGAVVSYAVGKGATELEYINSVSSRGAGPCHITADSTERYVYAANYISGSIAMFPVGRGARLEEASSVVQHQGVGADPERQEGPHAHSVNLSPDESVCIAADLGVDKLFLYPIDRKAGGLNPPLQVVEMSRGAGPRHLAFRPDGLGAYCVNELASTVTVLKYDGSTKTVDPLQEISTLPAGYDEKNIAADIHLHPSGRFLYATNRGHDSIVVFHVDEDSGGLTFRRTESTRGKTPRNFTLTPEGDFLLAANQDSSSVTAYRIDGGTGDLEYTTTIDIPSPVCLRFL